MHEVAYLGSGMWPYLELLDSPPLDRRHTDHSGRPALCDHCAITQVFAINDDPTKSINVSNVVDLRPIRRLTHSAFDYSSSNPWLVNFRVRLFSVTVRTT